MSKGFDRRALLGTAAAAATVAVLPGRAAFAQAPAQGQALPPAPTPEQWAKAPEIDEIALSPDGTQIAYIREQEGSKLLFHYNGLTKAFQTFNVGPNEVDIFKWIDNEHLAVSMHKSISRSAYMGLRDKFYVASIYNLTKKNLITLFDATGSPGRWAGSLNRITHDGKTQILTSCYDDERRLLVRFPLDNKFYEIVDVGGFEVEKWVTTPEGELVGRSEYYTEQKTWKLSYRRGNDWKEIYTHKGDLTTPSLVGLGRDGKTLVVYIQEENDDGHYFEVDADGKFSDPLPTPGISYSALFDPATLRFSGFAAYDDWFSYHYFDPARQALVAKAQHAVDGYRMSIAGQADDPAIMIVYSEGEDDAGTYYLINFNTGQSMVVGMEYPDIPIEWITTKKPIRYKAADGLEIEAYLTLPVNKDPKNLPLIMHPHGGPASRDDLSFDWFVQACASRGYAVLQPNFRGSSGYGYEFERAGDGQVGRKMQTDLSDGVRFLVAQGLVDPKRVCIVGTSYGGYAAFAGATIDTGVYNCAVAIAGLSDTTKWLEAERSYMSIVTSPAYTYTKRLLGDETKLDEISPIKHIDRVTIPILIMHGKNDSVVPITQSTDMLNALKAAGKSVTYVQVEHAEHGATNESSRIDIVKAVTAFLATNNPA